MALAHEETQPPDVARGHREHRALHAVVFRDYVARPAINRIAHVLFVTLEHCGRHVAQALDPALHLGDYGDRLGALLLPRVVAAVPERVPHASV